MIKNLFTKIKKEKFKTKVNHLRLYVKLNIHQTLSMFCLLVRKLGEECKDPKQCSMATNNSTCNMTRGVCQCAEGHLKVLNTCLPGKVFYTCICRGFSFLQCFPWWSWLKSNLLLLSIYGNWTKWDVRLIPTDVKKNSVANLTY